ncbi:beta-1 4-galactosyltransferase 7-like isoform X1 [Biomphalaria pfeifferi]|uniref:Beta-1,4-galactosyltransferase n=1 Tax=Biomphalaria pfeifferi TaxID=112525 RepID=A0AAD8F4D5_BIOPF|nr:beta-1 4-galactosyltransferase 7-like isoform X1 [Biomphalaria pfeifferi]
MDYISYLFRRKLLRVLIFGIFFTFLIASVWGILIVFEKDELSCNCQSQADNEMKSLNKKSSGHVMCIIVPFRDRFEELLEFAPYMKTFLEKQGVDYKLIVVNQMDRYRFNRASLINVGFLESRNKCDYIAMHDVDLLPVSEELVYLFPEESQPYHLAAPHLHPLYHYSNYAGGILLIRSTDFEKLNGLSNKYWGWGREDDEFFVRMKKAKFTLQRPGNLTTGYQSFKHIHDRKKRPRDYNRFFDQKEKTRRLDRETGISTVKYEVDSTHDLAVDDAPVTVINIYLECNVDFTPWCLQYEDHEAYLKQLEAKNLSKPKV